MTITEHIDQLDLLIGTGDIAKIRGYLQTFRQQAEAFDLRMSQLEQNEPLNAAYAEIDSLKCRLALYAQQHEHANNPAIKDIGGGLTSSAIS